MRTMKCSLLVSVDLVTPSEICQESDSELSRSLESHSTLSGSERRKSQSSEEFTRDTGGLLNLSCSLNSSKSVSISIYI